MDVKTTSGRQVHVSTLLEALNDFVELPDRKVCLKGGQHVVMGTASTIVLMSVLVRARCGERAVDTSCFQEHAPMRMPVSGVFKIKGVGDVITGRVEQGSVLPGDEVVFVPTHSHTHPCGGKVFTGEG